MVKSKLAFISHFLSQEIIIAANCRMSSAGWLAQPLPAYYPVMDGVAGNGTRCDGFFD
jgi:hypothetical protein